MDNILGTEDEKEMPSIEDAETDDEGVGMRGHSQMEEYKSLEENEMIKELLITMIPSYEQVSNKRGNNK
jgi:hypothetical protein